MACEYSIYGGKYKTDKPNALTPTLKPPSTWSKKVGHYNLDVHMTDT